MCETGDAYKTLAYYLHDHLVVRRGETGVREDPLLKHQQFAVLRKALEVLVDVIDLLAGNSIREEVPDVSLCRR